MAALAYHISPQLLYTRPYYARLLWEALPEFTGLMPEFTHIVVEYGPSAKLDSSAPGLPETSFGANWRKLSPPVKLPWNRASAYRKKLAQWLASENIQILVTADKEFVSKEMGVSVVLVSSAEQLLAGTFRKKQDRPPNWTEASRILLPLETDRNAVLAAFPGLEKSTTVVYPSFTTPLFPAGYAEKDEIKSTYTHGREYFLFPGPMTNTEALVVLLKAFSLFKKWLKTSMPLVLTGLDKRGVAAVEALIRTYKYREDILFYPEKSQENLKELVRGAYAMTLSSPAAADLWVVQWAFSAGVPIIAAGHPDKVWSDAVLLSSENDIENLANHLMLVFKDERLVRSLAEKGMAQKERFGLKTTLLAYQNLLKELIA